MVQDVQTPNSQTGLISGQPVILVNGDITKPSKVSLKKGLGLMNGVSIIIGIIVGSGIFISPKGVLQETGSIGSALVVWVLCGVLSIVGALCYAELGCLIPRSGGDYAYINESFGGLPSFLYLWCANVVFVPTTNAIMALTFANYVLQPLFPDCDPPNNSVRLLAASLICLLTFLNCYNVKWTTRIQDFFLFFKIAALAIIIIAGIVQLGKGQVQNFEDSFEGTTKNPGSLSLAFYQGFFSYAGWNYLNFVTEELRDPYRNLPRAIGIALPLVTSVYVLANLAYCTVLTQAEILASNAVAVSFADRLLGPMNWIMPLFVAGCTLGGLSCHIFTSARLCFVGARHGHFPDCMALISVGKLTPVPALVFLGILSTLMLAITDVYILINYSCFVEALFIMISIAGLLWLRWKNPNAHRPIKVPLFFPIFFFLVCAFLVFLPFYSGPKEVAVGLVIIVTGIPVYGLFIYWESKPMLWNKFVYSLTVFSQKLFIAVKQEGDYA